MTSWKRQTLSLLFAFVLPATVAAAPESRFDTATAALEAGDHAAARDTLTEIVTAGRFAPEVFFQLGNAHYRLGDTGRAALAYQRALYLRPGYPEAAQNLALLERQTGSATSDSGKTQLLHSISKRTLSALLAAAIWVTGGCAALLVLGVWRPVAASGCAAGVLLAAALVWAGARKEAARPPANSAIIVASGTVARTAPSAGSSEIVALPAGSEVKLVSRRGDWAYVALDDELRGWVPGSAAELLWPYDPGLAG